MQNCSINIFYDKNLLYFVIFKIGIFNNYMSNSIVHVTNGYNTLRLFCVMSFMNTTSILLIIEGCHVKTTYATK